MSGIAGIIHFDGRPVEPGQVEAMTAAMHYRGPDGIHHWRRGHVALGQCMLRTTPESLEEVQPLTNEDESLVLVMDGRVDNWEELRRELLRKGAVLRTRADAELVLRAYEVWSEDCLRHIEGDFALVIWDARRQAAFCARDRIGNKSLHYYWSGTTLAFSSDLHPLLELPWVERKVNEGVMAEFVTAEWTSRDETLWSGIDKLLAAHSLLVTGARLRLECYWKPDLWAKVPFDSEDAYAEAYRELFFDCVRRASRSHRPLAIEVSGGLDSSAVLGVAMQLGTRNALLAPDVRAYTLGFGGAGDADELDYARAAARHAGVDLQEVAPTFHSRQWFDDLARWTKDFPCFPNAAMFMGIRDQSARDGCRVTLTGEGGDEWMSGSRLYYAEAFSESDWKMLVERVASDRRDFGAARVANWLLRFGIFPVLHPALQASARRVVRAVRGVGEPSHYWATPYARRLLDQRRQRSAGREFAPVRHFGQTGLLEALFDAHSDIVMERAERLAALSGLELRYPMRDHRFVQFALLLPEKLRMKGDRSKYLHVKALERALPLEIQARTTKAEFSIASRHHLDKMQRELAEALARRHPRWLSVDGMKRLQRTLAEHPERGWPVWVAWSILALEFISASEG